jgi:DNA repair exonuclease SbcCD ATPase subunit
MLKLKSLTFKNIGRFVDEQTINFDSLGNLVQVDAQNNLTGGSSGSGKSTIFNALSWLLGLTTLPTTILQSRLTDGHIAVNGDFDWDGKTVLIKRAKKLSITVDGLETTGSSKLTEELLDEILGMPRDLFAVLLHKQQGEHGFFLALGPSKTFKFLTDSLGLTTISAKIDKIDQTIKALSTDKIELVAFQRAAQAGLEATKSAQESLGNEPITSITNVIVDGWKAQLEASQGVLESLRNANQLEKDALKAQKPKLTAISYDRTQIDAIEVEIKAIEAKINAEMEKERVRQLEVNNSISVIKVEANNKISALKLEHGTKIAESKTAMANLTNLINAGKVAKERAIQISSKIKFLRDGTCHTCLQPWQTEKTKTEEEILLKEFSECKVAIDASITASKEMEDLKVGLLALNERINTENALISDKMNVDISSLMEEAKPQANPKILTLKEKAVELTVSRNLELSKEEIHKENENQKNQKMIESFFLDQKTLDDKHQKSLDAINKEVAEYKNQYERAKQALDSHATVLSRYRTSLDSLKKKEDEFNQKLADTNQKLVDGTEKLEVAEEAKRCLKSYLSCSFDDALDSISDTATRILRSVPTMANATIRLQGQKETGEGALKDQVTAYLDNDGEIDLPIKSLSGGERSAVDLAIDLAVCEMIQERANKGIDIMILDEPFNGFDSTGIEHALEMLKTFAVSKKLLLVEHDSVAKEFIESRITVVRDGETSIIKSA